MFEREQEMIAGEFLVKEDGTLDWQDLLALGNIVVNGMSDD